MNKQNLEIVHANHRSNSDTDFMYRDSNTVSSGSKRYGIVCRRHKSIYIKIKKQSVGDK